MSWLRCASQRPLRPFQLRERFMVDRPLRRAMLNKCGLAAQINIEQGTARSTCCRSFSCLTNLAAGLSKEKLSHEEVLEVGKKTATDFVKLLSAALSI